MGATVGTAVGEDVGEGAGVAVGGMVGTAVRVAVGRSGAADGLGGTLVAAPPQELRMNAATRLISTTPNAIFLFLFITSIILF